MTHVVPSNLTSSSVINGEAATSLERMYEALPKRRKSAPVDPFYSANEPKPKKWKDLGVDPLSHSSAPLFDSYPYFLIDEDLEPTEQPLVVQDTIDDQFKDGKGSRIYPTLPKIPTQIRWDVFKNPYVPYLFSFF